MMLHLKGKTLSYKSYKSKNEKNMPTIVFLGGFMSDKNSTKADFLFNYCTKHGLNFVCFDYTGHGESSGTLLEGTISAWLEDSLDIIDKLTNGKVILVGSSMGGWIALLVALAIPKKISGIIGIAAAPDFTEELVWKTLSEHEKNEVMTKGVVEVTGGDKGEYKYHFTKNLIIDGRTHCLLNKQIPIKTKVVLLHGYKDKTAPLDMSLKIVEQLETDDVQVMLSKNSGHRMSQEHDLRMLEFAIEEFV